MSLRDITYDATKALILDDEPELIEGDYDQDDQHMVSAAAAVRDSVFVTADQRLIDQLDRLGLPSKHRFQVVPQVNALGMLCPDDL